MSSNVLHKWLVSCLYISLAILSIPAASKLIVCSHVMRPIILHVHILMASFRLSVFSWSRFLHHELVLNILREYTTLNILSEYATLNILRKYTTLNILHSCIILHSYRNILHSYMLKILHSPAHLPLDNYNF